MYSATRSSSAVTSPLRTEYIPITAFSPSHEEDWKMVPSSSPLTTRGLPRKVPPMEVMKKSAGSRPRALSASIPPLIIESSAAYIPCTFSIPTEVSISEAAICDLSGTQSPGCSARMVTLGQLEAMVSLKPLPRKVATELPVRPLIWMMPISAPSTISHMISADAAP